MMTDFLFNELVLSDTTHAANTEYDFTSWLANDNALGLEMSTPESAWVVNQLPYPTITSMSQVDATSFNTLLSHSFSHSDCATRFCESTAVWGHEVSHEAAASFGAGQDPFTHSFFPVTTSERHSKPKRVGAIAQSTPPRSQRHTPYPVNSDSTRKSISAATVYPCQWADCANKSCGAFLLNTKYAIGKHLQTVHAIRLKADKTMEMCRWEGCCKSMRRESIARHILAVHMQDKARCPKCATQFARTDSLQRHQRTPCIAKEETGGARK